MITFKSIFNKYSISEYKSSFLYIFSSKVLIACVTFITTPIIARIYNPADYGLFALMNSVALTISLLTSLSLPVCLLVIDENKVIKTTTAILGYSIFANILVLILGFLASGFEEVVLFGDFALTPKIISLVCLSSFLVTLVQLFANLNIREKNFKKNVAINLMDNFSIRLSSLSLGFLGFSKFGLFYAELTGKIVNILTQFYFRYLNSHLFDLKNLLRIKYIGSVIRENKEYPIYNLPVSLISNFSNQIVLWILALYFSRQSVGYFTMSLGLLNIPLLLLANSFQPLVTKKFFEASKDYSRKIFSSLSIKIFLISLFIYACIYLAAPTFIEIYLGPKWWGSIQFIQLLCLPFALQLLGSSIGGAFIVFSKQRANFIIKLVFLIVLLSTLYYHVTTHGDLTGMVILYSVIISAEELVKILYLILKIKDVRGS